MEDATQKRIPQGKWKKVGGINTYVATPTGEYPQEKVILYMTDVLGIQHIDAQVLVDDFAAKGFKTYAADYFNGDPVPEHLLKTPGAFDHATWLSKHGPDTIRSALDKVIEALKEDGITTFGATGYCFGARYVFDLASDNIIKVAVVNHPANLQIPTDLEKYYTSSNAPLLINSCMGDNFFPQDAYAKADDVFGGGKFGPGYKREHFEGCPRGFAVRRNPTNETITVGKEGAFKATVEWFTGRL